MNTRSMYTMFMVEPDGKCHRYLESRAFLVGFMSAREYLSSMRISKI